MSETIAKQSVLRWNLAFTAGATAASWALISPRFAGSLALGALLETVNFRALWRGAEFALLGRQGGAGAVVGAFGARFVLLAIVLWVAIGAGAHPVGLVVGLSVMMPAVILAAWQARPLDAPATEVSPPDDASWDAWNPWLAREREPREEDGE